MTHNTTKSTARAIALLPAQFTDPTVMPEMGRKAFDCFLHDLCGKPVDEYWKQSAGKEELENDEDFSFVEYFTTPVGPVMALHSKDQQSVIVVTNEEAV